MHNTYSCWWLMVTNMANIVISLRFTFYEITALCWERLTSPSSMRNFECLSSFVMHCIWDRNSGFDAPCATFSTGKKIQRTCKFHVRRISCNFSTPPMLFFVLSSTFVWKIVLDVGNRSQINKQESHNMPTGDSTNYMCLCLNEAERNPVLCLNEERCMYRRWAFPADCCHPIARRVGKLCKWAN